MSIVVPFVVAFSALCIWLTVRIVNRRERWAKWTAVGLLIGVLVVYPLSLGPACWLAGDLREDNWIAISVVPDAYYPILWIARAARRSTDQGVVNNCLEWYIGLWRNDGAFPGLLSTGDRVWFVLPDLEPESEPPVITPASNPDAASESG
jgi:hypothetical protein